jgi:hypothetical protein
VALTMLPHRQGHIMSIGPVNRPQENQTGPVVRADAGLLNQFRAATRTAQASTAGRSAETTSQTNETTAGGQAVIANAVTGKQSGGEGSGGDGESQQHKHEHTEDNQAVRTVFRNGQKIVLGTNGEVIRRIRLNDPEDGDIHFKSPDILSGPQQLVMIDMPDPQRFGTHNAISGQRLLEKEQIISEDAAKMAMDIWPELASEGVGSLIRFLRAVQGSADVPVRNIHIQLEHLKTANLLVVRQALMTFYGESQPLGSGRVTDILAFLQGAGAGDRAFTMRVARRLIQNNLSIGSRNPPTGTALHDIVEDFLLNMPDPNED